MLNPLTIGYQHQVKFVCSKFLRLNHIFKSYISFQKFVEIYRIIFPVYWIRNSEIQTCQIFVVRIINFVAAHPSGQLPDYERSDHVIAASDELVMINQANVPTTTSTSMVACWQLLLVCHQPTYNQYFSTFLTCAVELFFVSVWCKFERRNFFLINIIISLRKLGKPALVEQQ